MYREIMRKIESGDKIKIRKEMETQKKEIERV
jgi:hypothetical protein